MEIDGIVPEAETRGERVFGGGPSGSFKWERRGTENGENDGGTRRVRTL